MGQSGSRERQLYAQMLTSMLVSRGGKVSSAQVERFLKFVHEQCPWFPEEGTVSPETWERVGQWLKDFHAGNPTHTPLDAFSIWGLVRDSLGSVPESICRSRSLDSLTGPSHRRPQRPRKDDEQFPTPKEDHLYDFPEKGEEEETFMALTKDGIEQMRTVLDKIQRKLQKGKRKHEDEGEGPTAPPQPPPLPLLGMAQSAIRSPLEEALLRARE